MFKLKKKPGAVVQFCIDQLRLATTADDRLAWLASAFGTIYAFEEIGIFSKKRAMDWQSRVCNASGRKS